MTWISKAERIARFERALTRICLGRSNGQPLSARRARKIADDALHGFNGVDVPAKRRKDQLTVLLKEQTSRKPGKRPPLSASHKAKIGKAVRRAARQRRKSATQRARA